MRRGALVAFAVALPVWTWMLLAPNPVPPAVRELLGFWEHAVFVAAKSLHAGVYAGLAALGTVAAGPQWRAVAAGLVLHGAATEAGQQWCDLGRTGSVRDVVIDCVGVAAGTAAVRRWRP